jgi:hypothetical protein
MSIVFDIEFDLEDMFDFELISEQSEDTVPDDSSHLESKGNVA